MKKNKRSRCERDTRRGKNRIKREGAGRQAHTCINFRHSTRSMARSMRLASVHGDLRALLLVSRASRSGRSD